LTLSQAQAGELVLGGLNFANGDNITMDVNDAQSTHLSTSLKDLQKLGVDAVAISGDLDGNAATTNSLSIDMGSEGAAGINFNALPTFGDTSKDGTISTAEDNALNVTLDAQFSDLAGLTLGTNESKLASAGIDDISLSLTTEQQLVSLLQNGSANNLQIDQLQAANLGVDIDFGSGQVGIEALSVSATNQITLDANPETTGTHLSTSLKDLQKLGVDAVAISGMEDVTIDLGSGSGFQLDADGKFLQFTGANGAPLSSDVDITLQTTGLDQVLQASQLANTAGINLSDTGAGAVGIDNLGIDLSNNAADLTL
jgi:hypothetical protein